jgi:hypothetical protein
MSSAQPWKMDDGAGEESQETAGGGAEGGEESYGGESKPKVNNSTLALFAAFAAALIVLYLLGLQNKPRQASAEDLAKQAAVTSAIDDMLQHTGQGQGAKIDKLLSDTGRLVQLLLGALGSKAADIGDLPGNPFERVIAAPAARGDEEVVLPPSRSEQERLRLMAEEFGKLKVQMVITGSRPAAMINNQLVTLGGAVGEYFNVTEIQSTKVVLSSGGKAFVLKVDAPKGKP